jgi:hypothetical protein
MPRYRFSNGVDIHTGPGDPEGVVTAEPGAVYLSEDGLLYVKLSGSGDTGWEAATTLGTAADPNLDYLTHSDQTANLPNSRQLVAGASISFDDSIAGQRIIHSDAGLWEPLTDGDEDQPELIFADGDVIMVNVL